MIYHAKKGQVSSGEAIGILLLDTSVPFIPGDVANGSTYNFPVCFRKVEGFTVARAIGLDPSIYPALLTAAKDLEQQGVRAITGDCGFMALHQKNLARELDVPVFLSSLLQIPFILSILGQNRKIGVLTADGPSLSNDLIAVLDIADRDKLVIEGLEKRPNFFGFAIEENGKLDVAAVEREIVEAGKSVVSRDQDVAALLLECSLLPPYGKALQNAVNLPVFDYITMINFVFSAVVKKSYQGFV